MPTIRKIPLMCCLLILLGGCAGGRSAFSKGEKLEKEGKLDEAVLRYADAATANPDVGEYRLRFLKASEKAAQVHLKRGDEFFAAEKYDEALKEYQMALALNASLDKARQQQELVLTIQNSLVYFKEGQELEKSGKSREALHAYQKALNLNAENSEAKEALERLQKSKRLKMAGYELNLKSTKPITLKFTNAKLKDVFNILTKLSGINFIFDDAVKDVNISIYLENATFQQALDILTGVNKLGKKILNESTIIVYPKTPDKTKQYEELMVQTFYLNKLEAKKAVNLIRTMLQVKKIYVNEDMNALVIRDTPDVIEVAQKILEANDVPEAEMVLEVEVIEISKANTENFGLALSTYSVTANFAHSNLQGGVYVDTLLSDSLANAGTGVSNPPNLMPFNWGTPHGFMTVPNATYNFGKTLANSETLANPRIRVKNREKAKFNVGQRIPITTTSSLGTVGGVNVNVQYIDVGVKLNAEPTIQLNNDVSIKLSMEVSSVISKQTVGSGDAQATVVTIGTRNLDTVLSLKDGETSIIGGLIQDSNSKNKQKIFLLGDIPVIGPLLTSNANDDTKNELILAITPRLVRGITVPPPDEALFWSGKEDEPAVTKQYSSFDETEEGGAPSAAPSAESTGGGGQAGMPMPMPSKRRTTILPSPPTAPPPPTMPAVPGGAPQPAPAGPQSGIPAAQPMTAQLPAPAPGVGASAAVPLPATIPAPATVQAPAVVPAPVIAPTAPSVLPVPLPAAGQAAVSSGAPAPAQTPQPTVAPPAAAQTAAPAAVVAQPGGNAQPAASESGKPSLRFVTPYMVNAGDQVSVEVQVADVANLAAAPFVWGYDPKFFEFVNIAEGDFMKQNGKPTHFQATADSKSGQITVLLDNKGGSEGVSGSGVLAVATFKALKPGLTKFRFNTVYFTAPGGKSVSITPKDVMMQIN